MRDPRFEPAVVELPNGCLVGEETTLSLRPLPGQIGEAKIIIRKLGSPDIVRTISARLDGTGQPVELKAGKLEAGGYSATVEITPQHEAGGEVDEARRGPTTRRDFACERGGDEWADTRPDPERLQMIAAATGGRAVTVDGVGSLPLPEATQIAIERRVSPILPPWGWTLAAALFGGAHWVIRRTGRIGLGFIRNWRSFGASPPNPLSNSALLRNAAWRGGKEPRFSGSPSPRSGKAAKLERGPGGEALVLANLA
jgi:hypothetical protein